MSAPEKKATSTAKVTVAVSEEQVAHLDELSAIAKALAAPPRLAVVGALAARFPDALEVSELQTQLHQYGEHLDRELQQLAAAGLIEITAWWTPHPGTEPQPRRVALSHAYLRQIPHLITTLHQIISQVHPPAPRPVLSDREKTLSRFMREGRVLAWPDQIKQQECLSEEIVKLFAADTRYTEREVDAILKEVYARDHCSLRRSLIDFGLMARDHGVYWRVG